MSTRNETDTDSMLTTYRPLEPGERACRRTCMYCGQRHLALLDSSTGLVQCRHCDGSFWIVTNSRTFR